LSDAGRFQNRVPAELQRADQHSTFLGGHAFLLNNPRPAMSTSLWVVYGIALILATAVQRFAATRYGPALLGPSYISSGNSSAAKIKKGQDGLFSNVRKNLDLLGRGSTGLASNLQKSISLWKLQKEKGLTSLTFADYQFREQAKADLQKTLKLAVTASLSPQYFFYSYLVFPLLTSNNPWAWRSLPSTYDSTEYKDARESALAKRRMQAVVQGMHTLVGETIEGSGSPQQREQRQRAVHRIEHALQQPSMDRSLVALGPWLTSATQRAAQRLQLGHTSGAIVRQCVRALGGEGVPNIPIIRMWNSWDLGGRLRSVQKSDEFLVQKGVPALSALEVSCCCLYAGGLVLCLSRGLCCRCVLRALSVASARKARAKTR
jgi:hypothetical protein